MKKNILFLLLAFLLCPYIVRADDWSVFSFKGKVLKSTISQETDPDYTWCFFKFTSNGTLKEGSLYGVPLESSFLHNGNYTKYGAQFQIIMKNGKLSKIVEKKEGVTATTTLSYRKDGQLSKASQTNSWKTTSVEHISASSQMNAAAKKAYKLLAELAKLNPLSATYRKKLAEYQAAVKAANVRNTAAKDITRTQSHSQVVFEATFSDYEFDEHGNWTKRLVTTPSTSYVENQTIEYEPEFLSQFNWAKVEKTGDLKQVEAFFMDNKNTQTYRDKAQKYWNERILAELAEKYGNESQYLVHAASAPICSPETRDTALVIAREQIYQQVALKERDYVKLQELAEMKDRDMQVFNTEYQNKILSRAQQMRSDSIAYLQNQIDGLLNSKKYEEARMMVLGALKVDSTDATLRKQKAEAEFQLLSSDREKDIISSSDTYKQFLVDNPNSIYDEKVNGWYHHKYVQENRGRFWHITAGGAFSIGKGMYEASGGLGLLLGWHCSILNFYTGVQYGGFGVASGSDDSSDSDSNDDEDSKGGVFTGQHVTIPLELRFNFGRSFDSNFYVGLGANLNLGCKGYLGYTDETGETHYYDDLGFYKNPCFITPRLGIGFSGSVLEFELYGLYEPDQVVNEELINQYIQVSPSYKFDQKTLDKEFRHRFRIGIAARYVF